MKDEFKEFKEKFKGSYMVDMLNDFVEPEDEIEFKCTRCGKCCQNRDCGNQQILVSPLDIYNGAKELNITTKEFIKEYTESIIGVNSGLVLLTLACNENHDCKLLEYDENGLAGCKIHKSKPLICALHPLGIVHSAKLSDNENTKKRYVLATYCDTSKSGEYTKCQDFIDCVKGTDEEIDMAMKVRASWIENNTVKDITENILLYDILAVSCSTEKEREEYGFSDNLYGASKKVLKLFKETVGELDEDKLEMEMLSIGVTLLDVIGNVNFRYSYAEYDTDKPFLEQCKANFEKLKEFGKQLNEFNEDIVNRITSKLTEEQVNKISDFKETYPDIMRFAIASDLSERLGKESE